MVMYQILIPLKLPLRSKEMENVKKHNKVKRFYVKITLKTDCTVARKYLM